MDDAITRAEFLAAHQAVQADISRLDRQMNGNGQPGVVALVTKIAAWVERKEGEEEGEAKAKETAIVLAAKNEKKAARSRRIIRGIAVAVLGLLGWAGKQVWDVVSPPAAAIIEEYYEHHPRAVHHGYFDAPPQPGVSASRQPAQDSNLPLTYAK